jgi:hypothetical protein
MQNILQFLITEYYEIYYEILEIIRNNSKKFEIIAHNLTEITTFINKIVIWENEEFRNFEKNFELIRSKLNNQNL